MYLSYKSLLNPVILIVKKKSYSKKIFKQKLEDAKFSV